MRGTRALLGARFLLLFWVQPSCLSFVEHLFPDPPLCHNYVHCFHLTVPTVCVTVLHCLVIVVKIPKISSFTMIKCTGLQGTLSCSHRSSFHSKTLTVTYFWFCFYYQSSTNLGTGTVPADPRSLVLSLAHSGAGDLSPGRSVGGVFPVLSLWGIVPQMLHGFAVFLPWVAGSAFQMSPHICGFSSPP